MSMECPLFFKRMNQEMVVIAKHCDTKKPSCMTLGKLKPADRSCEVMFGLEADCPTLCCLLVLYGGGGVGTK